MVNKAVRWTIELLEKTDRNSTEWSQFVVWQKERILEQIKRYNNADTVKYNWPKGVI